MRNLKIKYEFPSSWPAMKPASVDLIEKNKLASNYALLLTLH